jgi:uncharacterized Fe-S cluster protein YjdI
MDERVKGNRMMTNTYKGRYIAVSYDPKVCIHSGECVRGLPQVFSLDHDPWIQPGEMTYDEALPVIQRCPSGALKLKRHEK